MATAGVITNDKWASQRPKLPPQDRGFSANEICVGSIVWLRQRLDSEEDITCVRPGHCSDFKLWQDGYMHPVVILKVWQRSGSTDLRDLMLGVSDMTTFKDSSIQTYTNNRHKLIKFNESIPILQPGEFGDCNIEQLSLGSGALRCKSWVRLQHVLLVSIRCLWMYDWSEGSHAYDQRLDKESYYKLTYKLGIQPDIYESTETVVNSACLRHRELARKESLNLQQRYRQHCEGRRDWENAPYFGTNNSNIDPASFVDNSRCRKYPNPALEQEYSTVQNMGDLTSQISGLKNPCNSSTPSSVAPQAQSAYTMSPEYASWKLVNNRNPNSYGRLTVSNPPNDNSGQGHGYQQLSPPLPAAPYYPPTIPASYQPLSQNNFYFHESTAFFDAPTSRNCGRMSAQTMQPAYQRIGQHTVQQMGQQMGQQMVQPTGQHRFQHMGQPSGQPTPYLHQTAGSYNTITPPRGPPPHVPMAQPRQRPSLNAQSNDWNWMNPPELPDESTKFNPRVPPTAIRNSNTKGVSTVSMHSGPARQKSSSPRRPAPYPAPHISPHKHRRTRTSKKEKYDYTSELGAKSEIWG